MPCCALHCGVNVSPLQGAGDEPVYHNPQGPRADQEKPVEARGKEEWARLSFKDVILPGFLHPQSNPTPNVPVPLSFRIPGSWSEAKYKIKVAHS